MTSYNKQMESFFDKFDETYQELLINDVNAANAFLAEEGFNPDLEIEIGNKLLRKIEFKLAAFQNKKRDDFLLEKAFEKLKNFIDKNKDIAELELRNILNASAPSYQFRNLEKLDDKEIRELLTEIDLIKLLEELDENTDY